MKVDLPDDFPHGPDYLGLTADQQMILVVGWTYMSRHHVDAVPPPMWDSLGAALDRQALEQAGIAQPCAETGVVRLPTQRVTRGRKVTGSDPRFDTWWSIWPRKQARRYAERAFVKALQVIDFDALMEATRRYVDDPNREDRYTPHGATWLNGERWHDEPLPSKAPARLDAGQGMLSVLEIGRQLAGELAAPAVRPAYELEYP